MLFLAGSRRIPAADSTLIVALDIVFGPALVWAVFGEAPTTAGLVGGAIVFVAVVANVVAGLATMLFGLLDDRLGPKRVILFSLGMLVALGLGIFYAEWVVGGTI